VSRPAPGDPKRVSYPKHMLVQCIPIRAKAPVNSVAPNCKAKGEPERKQGKPLVPKKETRSGARGQLAILHSKAEHCQLNSRPFHAAFSGINRG